MILNCLVSENTSEGCPEHEIFTQITHGASHTPKTGWG